MRPRCPFQLLIKYTGRPTSEALLQSQNKLSICASLCKDINMHMTLTHFGRSGFSMNSICQSVQLVILIYKVIRKDYDIIFLAFYLSLSIVTPLYFLFFVLNKSFFIFQLALQEKVNRERSCNKSFLVITSTQLTKLISSLGVRENICTVIRSQN